MSRNARCCFFALGIWTVCGIQSPPPSHAFEVEEVTLEATHRIYRNFHETHTVKLGERFTLSDTEYSAVAAEFVPDFEIDSETKKVISRSDSPNNPAVRVVVFQGDEQIDQVWAFPGKGAPHFFRNSFLAFTLIDYKAKADVPAAGEELGPAVPSGETGETGETGPAEGGTDR